MVRKLKTLRSKLKEWDRNSFGNKLKRKFEIVSEVDKLDKKEEVLFICKGEG